MDLKKRIEEVTAEAEKVVADLSRSQAQVRQLEQRLLRLDGMLEGYKSIQAEEDKPKE